LWRSSRTAPDFLVFKLCNEPTEIRGPGGAIVGLSHRRGMRFGLMVRTLETPFERRQRFRQSARHHSLSGLDIVATFLTGQRVQKVFAADDSDHLSVSHRGHALDPMCRKQTRDLAGTGVLSDGHDRRRHDLPCDALGPTEAGKEIRAKRLTFREQREPLLVPCVGLGFVPANEIALADHADGRAAIIEDRNRADMVLK
jgi:hypothetical protein